MKKSAKLKAIVCIALVFAVAFNILAFWNGLTVKNYTIVSNKLTDDITAVLITDLHSCFFGENQTRLLSEIEKAKPDLILLSGDIADDKTPDDGFEQLLDKIGNKYKCYYVTGNHEYWRDDTDYVKKMIESYGVRVLVSEVDIVSVNSQQILIGGVDDPDAFDDSYYLGDSVESKWSEQLALVCEQRDKSSQLFSILLSHRPEKVSFYKSSGFDLVASGHAHGGQFRIPFLLNGLFAPDQGFFPEYAGGLYDLGQTKMVVSRGLCNNKLPRFFNPPELVIINLKPKT